jgi:MoxR-like ATPase
VTKPAEIVHVSAEKPVPITDSAGRKVAGHLFPEEHQKAVNFAMAARRPLLVYGEPGSGKSQLARAAAIALKRFFVSTVVDTQTQPRDLIYELDLVQRLAKAQTLSLAGPDAIKTMKVEDELRLARFIRPRALWWGLNFDDAKKTGVEPPPQPKGVDGGNGVVVLIDEIDKGDPSVPNGLLGALGDAGFDLPDGRRVEQKGHFPLVVVTSNEERTLPAAFVRRCLVLRIEVPRGDAFEAYVTQRGEAHFDGQLPGDVMAKAARQLRDDREEHLRNNLPAPGQAEYLDLLRAVIDLARETKRSHAELVAELAPFAFRKHLRR